MPVDLAVGVIILSFFVGMFTGIGVALAIIERSIDKIRRLDDK
jgi:hypothetical protein